MENIELKVKLFQCPRFENHACLFIIHNFPQIFEVCLEIKGNKKQSGNEVKVDYVWVTRAF